MKINLSLNISSNEFYEFLINNLKNEINVKEIKEGMKFKKKLTTKLSKDFESEVEIFSLKYNKEYILKFHTSLGVNIIKYYIKEEKENKIELIYEEEYITDSLINKLNNTIMEKIYSFFLKRKMKKRFLDIEKYIVNKRNNGGK